MFSNTKKKVSRNWGQVLKIVLRIIFIFDFVSLFITYFMYKKERHELNLELNWPYEQKQFFIDW